MVPYSRQIHLEAEEPQEVLGNALAARLQLRGSPVGHGLAARAQVLRERLGERPMASASINALGGRPS
jgi:hypothetical protein